MSDMKNLAAKFRIQSPSQINQNDHIMLIEDQQDQRLILSHHLNKLGYQNVLQCANGLEALNVLKEKDKKISVIVASMEAGTMGGIDPHKGRRILWC